MKLVFSVLLVCSYGSFLPAAVDSCAATAHQTAPEQGEQTTTTTPAPMNNCGTMCQPLQEKRDSDDSQTVTQTPIENAGDGCTGFTQQCQGMAGDSAVIITWYDAMGNDQGSVFGTGSAMASVSCGPNNMLLFNGTAVSQVECISA
ncbi:hypothetical protein M3Y99_00072700 [Aphelenchoides fujianensis]|nr:hypothetical protein M3Y99_00072700 [Aphelenchoides fujianensis]